jgi:hypothetical protein
VGAGLAQCPNLTYVKYVCRCPWADPPPPRPRTCVHVGGKGGSSVCESVYVCVVSRQREMRVCARSCVRVYEREREAELCLCVCAYVYVSAC